ncbi:MAG: glucosyltransferase domain-containing protein [Lachnospiraceae bacterium]|nr:glucosyltransferase domain-containing protein [Lachnospiraceae bacterium]
MNTPGLFVKNLKNRISPLAGVTFVSAIIIGLLVHMPAFMGDFPNHDGLGSIYFDQNMITSGRWFLMIACGISSFYTLPWVSGVLALCYLGIASMLLIDLFKIKDEVFAVIVSGLIVTFPSFSSTCAYIYTLDGYMMGLMLAVLAVWLTDRLKKGQIWGAVALAFSMGIYQAYLPVCALLSFYVVAKNFVIKGFNKKSFSTLGRYVFMGAFGGALYYGLLKILLFIQGKDLDTYQGINDLESVGHSAGLIDNLKNMYKDFVVFSFKGKIIIPNFFVLAALILIAGCVVVSLFVRFKDLEKKALARGLAICAVSVVAVPLLCNMIMLISGNLTYHLVMRYQWVFLLVCLLDMSLLLLPIKDKKRILMWVLSLGFAVFVFNYGICDNIGYSNLSKKYERTYAFCTRLLDRIEQTPGYTHGVPIAMVGVVGDKEYPESDITGDVTGNMIGLSGEYLVYTAENYRAFMKNYLGADLNFVSVEEMGIIYNSEEYINMPSFPNPGSVKMVDGVIYVKTENFER